MVDRLVKIISCVPSVLKWKLCHHSELEKWTMVSSTRSHYLYPYIIYPVRAGKEFNLVLVRPDNLPKGERQAEGDLAEMRESFEGWDPM